MANKLVMAVFLLTFWLFYPIPIMVMESNSFEELQIDVESTETVDNVNFLTVSFGLIGQYFSILVLGIPNSPFLINRIINLFQLISGLVIFLLVRGN